jgi:hypothetical protein
MAVFAGVLSAMGCASLRDLVPEGPVLNYAERLAAFPGEVPSGVSYLSPPLWDHPVVPLQIFGVHYDLDLVLRTKHPSWDMHEYARILTPEGPLWLAKDARAGTLAQSIVADLPDINAWIPEVGVVRRSGAVVVADRSTATWLDLVLRYDNLDGQPTEVTYEGPIPEDAQRHRNSSTMGHSADQVAAVLDLSHRAFARRATVTIGGQPQPLVRVLGLVPMKLVLAQTQGGLSVGAWSARAEGLDVRTTRPNGVEELWRLEEGPGFVELHQRAPIRTVTYRFLRTADGALELTSAWVRQYAVAAETVHLQLAPALPDARRRWEGAAEGRFVVDVNGQPSHGVGRYEARWEGEEVVVRLIPEAPRWFAERPLEARIAVGAEGANVSVARVAVP